MKILFLIILTSMLPNALMAQANPLTEDQLQQMMQNIKQMQACFSTIDQAAIQRISEKGKALKTQIDTLCQSAKRAEAQQMAISFVSNYMASKEIKALQKCGENVSSFLPEIPELTKQKSDSQNHVCDSY